METNTKNTRDKEYDLTHIEDENHPTLGDPDECGSYWIKNPSGGANLRLAKEKLIETKTSTRDDYFYMSRRRCCKGIMSN